MEIIVGKTAGFCYGVERAVMGAEKEMDRAKEPVYCLGEIAHNKKVIEKLEEQGIKFIETIEEANGKVLIRAHGIPKEIYNVAEEMNLTIKDYTCPNVLKVQKIAAEFSGKDYFIFLLGVKNHPENIATLSHCGNYYYNFEKEEELEKAMQVFKNSDKKKLLLLSQTTYSVEKFQEIEKRIVEKLQLETDIEFVSKNTICRTTELRQKETEELSKKVDTMIIIGGKNSFNTKKLYEVAKKNCEDTILIESVEELCLEDFEKDFYKDKIGIMAGASTPKKSIDEVITFLKEGRK